MAGNENNNPGFFRVALEMAAVALCLIYLANPTLGFFELIPDNLPLGNLDEGAAGALLLAIFSAWRARRKKD